MADRVKRKLAAILSADVKGYSRLMSQDEVSTIRTLTVYREAMTKLIQEYRGRVVDAPGDNVLVEFGSVVDAVQCAVAVQNELHARNSALPENRKMAFRIGINLGDVIEESERIYGDGVNIAARLEGLAEPGGICISGTAYDQIEDKLPFEYEFLGKQTVKNIKKPVRVYRVEMKAEASVSEMSGELKLPDEPSIAVLPFTNMTGDSEQEYFSDGITEDIITDLSKISNLFVIARNSSFTYKGKAVKVQQVGQELGVRYILEGSVRKAGQKVRITAQLVDSATGGHLWAERYDRNIDDIFALQDDVTQKIVGVLALKITKREENLLGRKHTENLEAYDNFLRGMDYYYQFTKEGNETARQFFEKAISFDPEFVKPHAAMGYTHWTDWSMGWSQTPQSLNRAFSQAQKSVTLDDSYVTGHRLLGHIYLWRKEHEQAFSAAERAISLDPNDDIGYALLGEILTWSDRPEETFPLVEKAMRLNPYHPAYYLWILGQAFNLTKQYEKAMTALRRAIVRNPDFVPTHISLAVTYSQLGFTSEAQAQVSEILRISPNLTLNVLRHTLPFKEQSTLTWAVESLRQAGLK